MIKLKEEYKRERKEKWGEQHLRAEGHKAGTEEKEVTPGHLLWASKKGQTWHRLGQAGRTAAQ